MTFAEMTTREVATAFAEADVAGDEQAAVEAMNELVGRAGIPLDQTEQGLTPEAAERFEQFYADAFK